MTYRYLSEARQELDRHMAEYEQKEPGLGLEFLDEVVSAIGRIIMNPEAWTKIDPKVRRCLTSRFPYSVLYTYRKKEQEIVIVAIMHQHQKPGYWQSRQF